MGPVGDSVQAVLDAPDATRRPCYSVVTPVYNEAANLERLAGALAAQALAPKCWVVVDTGSTDNTAAVAGKLALAHPWIELRRIDARGGAVRGGPIVRAFTAGLEAVPSSSDVIVKLDADISFEPDHFERLLGEFERDARLGIASGTLYEQASDGVWRQRHGTGPGVWGAARAYRRVCLDAVLPLEERMGWDTIDLLTAAVAGWTTRVVHDLPVLHHRPEAIRDRSRFSHWVDQGRAAHYMGYRVSYLMFRTLYRSLREPSAAGIVYGYFKASARREPRCPKAEIIAYVRRNQSLARLPRRIRETLRTRKPLARMSTLS
jgi:poly-beta-1,6-N-acetyl-D-glucosamine synthase